MTPLQEIVINHIQTQGPLTVEAYMQLCLYHPEHGYYTRGLNFSTTPPQDFTTAPELTPLFAHTLAEWLVPASSTLGPFMLLEAGPGRGTLMNDILTHLHSHHPRTYAATRPHLIETSPALTQIQQKTLQNHPQCQWSTTLPTHPTPPIILLANELLDAFPTRQFCHQHERTILLDENNNLSFSHPDSAVTHEDSPQQEIWLNQLKSLPHLHQALLIDYGYTSGAGDTLQALHKHQKINPLQHLGEADLTTHIDFTHIAKILGPQNCTITDLAPFLLKNGLLHVANPTHPTAESTLHRLLHPSQMGTLFKVLCYTPSTQ